MRWHIAVLVVLLAAARFASAESPAKLHTPDPVAVQRYEAGYRYPQAGWIVLHVQGGPHERGYQHGRLMANEIAAYVRCFAAEQSAKAPEDGWRLTRTLVNALFLRRFDREYLEEMKGIADGAAAAGAKFDNRPIDLVDIAAINCWAEIETLDGALQATPTGLEGIRFRGEQPKKMPAPPMGHCSAFAANGPATADGKIVFGHITMFGLYAANYFNVWLDVKPAAGHRVLMQSYPGGIQSGMDYYQNDAGLMVCETTIKQTRFNQSGLTLASRIRKALQYSTTIDELASYLTKDNNGLYTNEWLIGDAKTDEIAMLQLGTGKSRLSRSGKNEWFGGTEGFYWGCNNTKDLELRLETIPGTNDRPANMVWHASDRDKMWQKLYREHKGKIDANFAKLAFTTPPLAAIHSLDAKFTTSALAKDLKSVGLYGPPLGKTWLPGDHEKKSYPEIRPLVSHPWTILHGDPPPTSGSAANLRVVDLNLKVGDSISAAAASDDSPPTIAAWHGTILPTTDADVWLAAAFADYEPVAALENAYRQKSSEGKLTNAERDRLALELNSARAEFSDGQGAFSVNSLRRKDADDLWYRRAAGKGVWILHELRRRLGAAAFDAAADSFGRKYAGRAASTADFQKHLESATGKKLGAFFDYWVRGDQLPRVGFEDVALLKPAEGQGVAGRVKREGPYRDKVSITLRSKGAEVTQEFEFHGDVADFRIKCGDAPRCVVIDEPGDSNFAEGRRVHVRSFWHELEETLIVYGTWDEEAANRDAAFELQDALRRSGPNITVPVKSDQEASPEYLKGKNLLLIGRPETNRLVADLAEQGPIRWGPRSFTIRGDTYAHANSGVIYALPVHDRVAVIIAGLGAEATRSAATRFTSVTGRAATAVVLPAGTGARQLVIPNRDSKQRIEFAHSK
ncbi:MAG: C45 family autoproteolytic acyltransferase/hydrolase [Gemmataceae bacterium]